MRVVFEGGGFPAFWYGLGYGLKMIENREMYILSGYSAGALVAAILVCCYCDSNSNSKSVNDLNLDFIVRLYGETQTSSRFGRMSGLVTTMMCKLLPSDAHKRANNRLGVILCDPNRDSKCRIVTNWDSRDELIQCLVASCYIPCFMGCIRMSDETYECRDALFSTNLPDVLNCFHEVVSYRPYVGFDLGRLCENMSATSHERTLSLLEEGRKDCEINMKKNKMKNYLLTHVFAE